MSDDASEQPVVTQCKNADVFALVTALITVIVGIGIASQRVKSSESKVGRVIAIDRVIAQPRGDGWYTGPIYHLEVDGKVFYVDGTRTVGEQIPLSIANVDAMLDHGWDKMVSEYR